MNKIICFIGIIILLASIFYGCSDPLSGDKDAIVRILIDGQLERAKYTVYWDGKNDEEKYVTPGTYYARLYNNSQPDDQRSMLVHDGGTAEANYSGEPVEYNYPGFFEIESIEPDTFKVKEGTNITFIIDDQAAGTTVRLVIRNKK